MICFTLLLMCGGVLCIVAPLDFRENNESDVLCAALDDDRLPYSVGEWRQRNEPPAQWRDCRLLDADRVLSRSRFCDKYGKSAPHNLEWVPAQCRLLKFNAERWWSALRGRDLIFFGDSIVNQQYLNLGCSLEAYGANATLTLTTAPGVEGGAVHNVWAPLLFTCNDCDTPVTQKRPLSRPARIHFERTEDVLQRLLLSIDERRRRRSILLFSISAWYSERKLTDLALLLNVTRKQRAAAAERMFEDATRRFFNMTVGSFPGSVLARSAAPSHPNCRRVLKDPSVVAPQRPVTAMGSTAARNAFLKRLVDEHKQEANVHFLDIESLSATRPDGHPATHLRKDQANKAVYDCLHWCNGGPTSVINTWNDLLLTAISQLADDE